MKENQKSKYIIVRKSNLEELQDKCEELMNQGYDVHGDLLIEKPSNDIGFTFYIQAFIKY